MAARRRAGALLLCLAPLLAAPLRAADLDRARTVVLMVYDIGLYGAELDRAMAEGASAGGKAAGRDRGTIHTLMLGQRDAVLSATASLVAARASDTALNELLRMAAASDAPTNPRLIDEAVTVVKSSFRQVLRDALAGATRGAVEFACTREQRSRCT